MTTVVTIAVTSVGMTVTLVTIGTTGTTAPGKIVTGMTAATAGNAPGRPLAAPKPMIAAPGLHLPGGITTKKGLQGTMTGGVAMITEGALILPMTVAGTLKTGAGTTVDGTRGTIVTRTGLPGTPTEMVVGRQRDEVGHGPG